MNAVKKAGKYLTGFVVLVLLALSFVINMDNTRDAMKLLLSQDVGIEERIENAQTSYKESFANRSDLINLYGSIQRLLGKRVIGDFEFIRDYEDNIQILKDCNQTTEAAYLRCVQSIQARADSTHTPLVFIAFPDRAEDFGPKLSGELPIYCQLSQRMAHLLEEKNIDCLNLRPLIDSEPDAPTLSEFYLHTDAHGTTRGEFWSARELARYLEETYGVVFPDAQKVFDLNQYDIKAYPFLGGSGHLTGEYYAGLDDFEIYYPKFETNIVCENPAFSDTRSGDFETVMLNGYEKSGYTVSTYWITNFGHFTSPYYSYTNYAATEGSPRILVICDSIFMRGFSYLALACARLTVADPRFFGGIDYVKRILDAESFDAIVVVSQTTLDYSPFQVAAGALSDLPVHEMVASEVIGKSTVDEGMCIGVNYQGEYYDYGKLQQLGGVIPVDLQSETIDFYGWGFDFWQKQPFQGMYIQAGDTVVPCNYGLESPVVAQTYGWEEMGACAFGASLPTASLRDGEVRQIAVMGVSANGDCLYWMAYPVVYPEKDAE